MFDVKKILEDAVKPFKTRLEATEKTVAETNQKVDEILEILKNKK